MIEISAIKTMDEEIMVDLMNAPHHLRGKAVNVTIIKVNANKSERRGKS